MTGAATRAPHGHARRWAIAGASTAACLGLAELVCRAFVPAPMRVEIRASAPLEAAPSTVRLEKHPGQGGVYVDAPSGRRLRPNVTAYIEKHSVSGLPVEIRTNSIGYRNREIGPKKGRRILFLGDSITFADYLPEEACFVRQVETIAKESRLDWETINAGVGAVSLKTELAILLETGLALDPDVVVLDWYLNDFQDSRGVEVKDVGALARASRLAYALERIVSKPRESGAFALPVNEWKAEWVRDELPRLAGDDPERKAFYREAESVFFDWGGAWSPHAWEVMRPVFDELNRVCRERNVKLVWLAFPTRQQVEAGFDAREPQQRLTDIARELGVPLLDLLPVLQDLHRSNAEPVFYDQCHHTGGASRVLARAIFEWLKQV